MAVVFSCANCGKRFEVDSSVADKKAKCKQCGHIFLIPTPRAVAPQPASRQPASRRGEAEAWPARQAAPVPDPFDRFGLDEPMSAPKPASSTYLPSYAEEEELPPPKRIGPTPPGPRNESSGSRWSSDRRGFWDGIPGPM
jgi:DNA-directed RNA polymerase subunit RPC12/RpoP